MARFSPARIRKDEGTPGDETYTRVSDFFGCIWLRYFFHSFFCESTCISRLNNPHDEKLSYDIFWDLFGQDLFSQSFGFLSPPLFIDGAYRWNICSRNETV